APSRALQAVDDFAIGGQREARKRERRPARVACEPLEPEPIVGSHVSAGVEREALEKALWRGADGTPPSPTGGARARPAGGRPAGTSGGGGAGRRRRARVV